MCAHVICDHITKHSDRCTCLWLLHSNKNHIESIGWLPSAFVCVSLIKKREENYTRLWARSIDTTSNAQNTNQKMHSKHLRRNSSHIVTCCTWDSSINNGLSTSNQHCILSSSSSWLLLLRLDTVCASASEECLVNSSTSNELQNVQIIVQWEWMAATARESKEQAMRRRHDLNWNILEALPQKKLSAVICVRSVSVRHSIRIVQFQILSYQSINESRKCPSFFSWFIMEPKPKLLMREANFNSTGTSRTVFILFNFIMRNVA